MVKFRRVLSALRSLERLPAALDLNGVANHSTFNSETKGAALARHDQIEAHAQPSESVGSCGHIHSLALRSGVFLLAKQQLQESWQILPPDVPAVVTLGLHIGVTHTMQVQLVIEFTIPFDQEIVHAAGDPE